MRWRLVLIIKADSGYESKERSKICAKCSKCNDGESVPNVGKVRISSRNSKSVIVNQEKVNKLKWFFSSVLWPILVHIVGGVLLHFGILR
jgi:hypothetical protein